MFYEEENTPQGLPKVFWRVTLNVNVTFVCSQENSTGHLKVKSNRSSGKVELTGGSGSSMWQSLIFVTLNLSDKEQDGF